MREILATHRQTGRPLGRFGVPALVIGIFLLIGIGAASVWAAQESAIALETAQRSRRSRGVLTDLMLQVEEAETSQRGYLLTGDQDYLRQLDNAVTAVPGLVDQVANTWIDDQRVVTLKQVLTAKLSELQRSVDLARGGDFPGALAIVRTNAGSRNMDIFRHLIATLEAELDANLSHEVAAVFRDNGRVIMIDVAGLLTIAALSALILFSVRSYLANLAKARAIAEDAYGELARSNERLDEMVRSRTADLLAVNEEVQRFAHIVSHDLRAPLVNIMGFTSELEQASEIVLRHAVTDAAPPELREAALEDIPEALRFIKSSTVKMDRLINAILKLSREGRRVLTAEPIAMLDLFKSVAETLGHQAGSKDAQIVIKHIPDVIGDRLALEQVFGNLIDNALKYLRPGVPGRIEISGAQEGVMVRFDIADNGRGIAPGDRERVFELFRRAGDQSVPGEGIGLAHVRALIRRLGGTIDCTSSVGVGTTFTIRLPSVAAYSREIAA